MDFGKISPPEAGKIEWKHGGSMVQWVPVVQITGSGRDVGRLLTDPTRVLTGKLTVACVVDRQ